MATPCCPKCEGTNFSGSYTYAMERIYLIHCTNCGCVVGAVPQDILTKIQDLEQAIHRIRG